MLIDGAPGLDAVIVIVYIPAGVVGAPGMIDTDGPAPHPIQDIVSISITSAGAARATRVCGANRLISASESNDSSHSTVT